MNKVQRRSWTDEDVERELRAACVELGHFPSAQELRRLGRNDLAVKASRCGGGLLAWSEKIGVDRRVSDSDTGWAGEKMMSRLLVVEGFRVERPTEVKCPYDLLANDVLRLDIKTANYVEYGACRGWFYRIGKYVQADMIILCQLDTEDFYALPWWRCPKSNVTISRDGGKYRSFKNQFDLIRSMIDLRAGERTTLGEQP